METAWRLCARPLAVGFFKGWEKGKTMPISVRKLDSTIIVDGVRRSINDLGYLLAVLDPEMDQALWDYYFAKWTVLDGKQEKAS